MLILTQIGPAVTVRVLHLRPTMVSELATEPPSIRQDGFGTRIIEQTEKHGRCERLQLPPVLATPVSEQAGALALGTAILQLAAVPELSHRSFADTMPANAGRLTPRAERMGRLAIILMLVVLLEACESNSSPPVQSTRQPDIHLAPDSKVSRGVVPRDSTLETMLLEQGLQTEAVHGVIDAVKTVFDPRRLRSFQPFTLEQTLDGALRLFE